MMKISKATLYQYSKVRKNISNPEGVNKADERDGLINLQGS